MKNKRWIAVLACLLIAVLTTFGGAGSASAATQGQSNPNVSTVVKVIAETEELEQYQIEITMPTAYLEQIEQNGKTFDGYLDEISSRVPDFVFLGYQSALNGVQFIGTIIAVKSPVLSEPYKLLSEGFFVTTYEGRKINPIASMYNRQLSTTKAVLMASNNPLDHLLAVLKYGDGDLQSASSYFGAGIKEMEASYAMPRKMGMRAKTGQNGNDGYIYYGYGEEILFTRMQFNSIACYGAIAVLGVILAVVLLLVTRKSKAQPSLVDTTEREKRRLTLLSKGQPMTAAAAAAMMRQAAQNQNAQNQARAPMEDVFGESGSESEQSQEAPFAPEQGAAPEESAPDQNDEGANN